MYKTKLQEMCAKKSWTLPKYSAVKDGPDHKPCFRATVSVNGAMFGSPTSSKSVKEAHNKAAETALTYFISISSTGAPNSPSSGHITSKDYSKMAETSKSKLPAGEAKVLVKNPELHNKQVDECNTLVKNCNLKNSKSVANPLEREINDVELNMDSLSLKESSQDTGPKLAKGGASALKRNRKFDSANNDGSSNKGKGKLMSENSYAPAESSVDYSTKVKDPEGSSFLLCDRVRVYSYAPDITKFPKGVTVMQIYDNMWVAVSLDFPNEKAY